MVRQRFEAIRCAACATVTKHMTSFCVFQHTAEYSIARPCFVRCIHSTIQDIPKERYINVEYCSKAQK